MWVLIHCESSHEADSEVTRWWEWEEKKSKTLRIRNQITFSTDARSTATAWNRQFTSPSLGTLIHKVGVTGMPIPPGSSLLLGIRKERAPEEGSLENNSQLLPCLQVC